MSSEIQHLLVLLTWSVMVVTCYRWFWKGE